MAEPNESLVRPSYETSGSNGIRKVPWNVLVRVSPVVFRLTFTQIAFLIGT